MKSWKKFLSLNVVMAIGLTGCMPDSMTKYKVDPVKPVATSTSTTTTTTTGTTTNFATESYMKITEETGSGVNYYLHRHENGTTNLTANCQVAKTDIAAGGVQGGGATATNSDITCILDAEELDLYYNGIKPKLVVPSGVCEYIMYDHYYFYRYQYKRSAGNTGGRAAPSETVTEVVCTNGCAPCTPTGTLTPVCSGDYTASDGPNCDDGYVTKFVTTYPDADNDGTCEAPVTTPSVAADAQIECGGTPSACLGGPALEHQALTTSGYPASVLVAAIDGYEKQWNMSSPSDKGYASNVYLANYTNACVDSTDVTNTTYRYSDETGATTDNLLAFAQDTTMTAGANYYANNYFDPRKGTEPTYTFYCLDRGYEILARIRLMVRDWDKRFTSADATTTGPLNVVNNTTKMDVATGPFASWPVNATYFELANPLWPYNDKYDWDNFRTDGVGGDDSPACDSSNLAGAGDTAVFNFPGGSL